MFKEGNLVRLKTEDGDGEIVRVIKDMKISDSVVNVSSEKHPHGHWEDADDYELVSESQMELVPVPNPHPIEEQTVAIVSFEGAVKREVKAIRAALAVCETISYINLTIDINGPVDGDVKIEYKLSKSSYGTGVTGSNIRETLAEFLRRNGWDSTNKPIAISYDGVPS
jgi:hypothetical protein